MLGKFDSSQRKCQEVYPKAGSVWENLVSKKVSVAKFTFIAMPLFIASRMSALKKVIVKMKLALIPEDI